MACQNAGKVRGYKYTGSRIVKPQNIFSRECQRCQSGSECAVVVLSGSFDRNFIIFLSPRAIGFRLKRVVSGPKSNKLIGCAQSHLVNLQQASGIKTAFGERI